MPHSPRAITSFLVIGALLSAPALCHAQADDEEDTVTNPLTDLIQGLFGAADRPGFQDELAPGQADGQFKDKVDDRASSDLKLTRKLDLADEHIERGKWHAAIEILQSLLSESPDTLCRDSDGRWTSLQTQVEARIGRMPAQGLEDYRTVYEGRAAQMLIAGGGLSDYRTCIDVARRHFHTEAAQ